VVQVVEELQESQLGVGRCFVALVEVLRFELVELLQWVVGIVLLVEGQHCGQELA